MKKIKISLIIIIVLVSTYSVLTIILPSIVDKKYNKVLQKPPYKVSLAAQQLTDTLNFIADMHCDALLWKRNLLKKHDFGDVDIPRMIQANEALQAFTIVTKVPKNINFDRNTDKTDALTLPFILEGRPFKSWFNLTQRALVQCVALNNFAKQSDGKFWVIKSQTNLRQ